MNDKYKASYSDQIEPSILNDQIGNDENFSTVKEFHASHTVNILEKLIHLSRFGNLLTLVVGNNGSGKSHLLQQLVNDIDDSSQVCLINAQPLLSIDQLFQQVIESFAGETTFTGIPLTANQYEEWAEQLSVVSGNRLLIIDDAEVLSTSVLHELCQLSAMQQAKETPHLHLILFGNYDLNSILEQSAHGVLGEDGIYAIDIPELDDVESRQLIDFLFKQSGVVFLPDEEEIENMIVNCQGNLALIKESVTEYSAVSHEINDIETETDQWKISAVGYWFASFSILIISVLGLFFYQDELIELTGYGQKDATIVKVPVLTTQSESIDSNETADVEKAEEQTLPYEEVVSIEKISQAVELPDDINTEEPIAVEPIAEEDVSTDLATNVVESDVTESDITESDITGAEQYLLSSNDDDYVIQLIGLSKEATVKSFLRQFDYPNIKYYRSSLSGKPWYIISLTGYTSRKDAEDAKSLLAEELLKNGPWIKTIKAVKADILKAKQINIQ